MQTVRRVLTWLIALPLIAVGSQVAHGIAYWWAYPVVDVRDAVLHRSGHGYEAYAPTVLGLVAAVELLVLFVAVVDRARQRHAGRGLPPWAFLWLPLVVFTVQEHLERYFATGIFPWWTVQEPTFWRGLLLQVPLGLLAYAVARLLLRTVEVVGSTIAALRRGLGAIRTIAQPSVRWLAATLPRPAPLALAAAGRAPPSPAR